MISFAIVIVASCSIFNRGPKSDKESKAIVSKAIIAAGGQDALKALKEISYLKKIKNFKEDGTMLNELFEIHNYDLASDKGRIEWINNSLRSKLSYSGDTVKFAQNARYDTTNQQLWLDKKNSSHYILFMPWKLTDKKAITKYMGTVYLEDNTLVDVVYVTYPSDKLNLDEWWYYFNTKTGVFEGNMVKHNEKYSYVRNQSMSSFKGLKLHKNRTSYSVDSARNIIYKQAEYEYLNYK